MASPLSHTMRVHDPDRLAVPGPSRSNYDRRRHGIHNLQRDEVIADPASYYTKLAEPGPLFYDQVSRVWVCSGYPESVKILTDAKTFSSARPHGVSQLSDRGFGSLSRISSVLARQLLFTDPPDHSTIRSAIAKEFTPAAVDARSPMILGLVEQSLNALPMSGSIDIVSDFAEQLPTGLIASLLGLEEYVSRLPVWADAYERLIGSLSTLPHVKDESVLSVLDEAGDTLLLLAEQRLHRPGNDLISRIVQGVKEAVTAEEALNAAVANGLVMVAGGYQTLTHLVSNGLLLLDKHPEQQQLVRTDPSLAAAAVNETMRLEGSSQYVARRALADTTIGVATISAGETVIVLLAAANLDARQFPAPYEFNVRRQNGRHLGFGRGRHYCIGAPYAERMAMHAITGFLRRYPSYRLGQQPDAVSWGPHANTRCPQHVRVEVAAASPVAQEPATRSSASDRERFLIDTWNNTSVPIGPWRGWHHVFEQQALACPEAVAIEYAGRRRTYREVDRLANGLAHQLRRQGVEPESVVAIAMDRSEELVVAMLAVAKAGGAFLLADANCPPERLTVMIEEATARCVLTEPSTAPKIRTVNVPTAVVDLDAASDTPPVTGINQGNTAYVVFTSGTTGRPKGIAISHEGVVNLHRAQRDVFRPGTTDRVLQFLSPSWDGCIFEVAMALMSGATLVVVPAARLVVGPPLLRILKQHRITILTCTPAVWSALPNDPLPDLRIAAAAGERLPAKTVAKWRTDRRRFLNLYGPAEAAVWSSWHECDGSEEDPPIGRPISNKRLYVLDSAGEPVPIGTDGELCVAGLGIGRYLGRPELMEESFAVDPSNPSQMLYRTGDICRWRADGVLEYRGRRDRQAKIRGQRVELDEVERVLETASGVVACSVEVTDGRLVARVVTSSAWDEKTVGTWMKERLHSGMVPTEYQIVDELPRTLNGKVASSTTDSVLTCTYVTSTRSSEPELHAASEAPPVLRIDHASCGNVTSRQEPPLTVHGFDISPATRQNVTSLGHAACERASAQEVGPSVAPADVLPIGIDSGPCGNVTSRAQSILTWKISRMFATSLGIPQVSVKASSDFFDIGGDSLTVAEFLSRLERDTDVELDIEALLSAPTPATIADLVATRLSTQEQR